MDVFGVWEEVHVGIPAGVGRVTRVGRWIQTQDLLVVRQQFKLPVVWHCGNTAQWCWFYFSLSVWNEHNFNILENVVLLCHCLLSMNLDRENTFSYVKLNVVQKVKGSKYFLKWPISLLPTYPLGSLKISPFAVWNGIKTGRIFCFPFQKNIFSA